MKLKIIPPVVFVLSLLLMFVVHYFTSHLSINIMYRVAASRVLFAIGALIAMMGILAFRSKGTTTNPARPEEASSLVTHGIYRVTRNPMYMGMVLILTGGVIRTSNPYTLIAVVVFMWYITRFQIKPEEEALSGIFGEEYKKYCQRVRRWI